ncbi:MAG: hypothetical protein BWY24_00010 [Microgenomates group bacterium ADurb.Bin219]|nr:MAG: hypothetical protein BWY24_00010 [Microgenomates group bacterium ADurb.Bin219]
MKRKAIFHRLLIICLLGIFSRGLTGDAQAGYVGGSSVPATVCPPGSTDGGTYGECCPNECHKAKEVRKCNTAGGTLFYWGDCADRGGDSCPGTNCQNQPLPQPDCAGRENQQLSACERVDCDGTNWVIVEKWCDARGFSYTKAGRNTGVSCSQPNPGCNVPIPTVPFPNCAEACRAANASYNNVCGSKPAKWCAISGAVYKLNTKQRTLNQTSCPGYVCTCFTESGSYSTQADCENANGLATITPSATQPTVQPTPTTVSQNLNCQASELNKSRCSSDGKSIQTCQATQYGRYWQRTSTCQGTTCTVNAQGVAECRDVTSPTVQQTPTISPAPSPGQDFPVDCDSACKKLLNTSGGECLTSSRPDYFCNGTQCNRSYPGILLALNCQTGNNRCYCYNSDSSFRTDQACQLGCHAPNSSSNTPSPSLTRVPTRTSPTSAPTLTLTSSLTRVPAIPSPTPCPMNPGSMEILACEGKYENDPCSLGIVSGNCKNCICRSSYPTSPPSSTPLPCQHLSKLDACFNHNNGESCSLFGGRTGTCQNCQCIMGESAQPNSEQTIISGTVSAGEPTPDSESFLVPPLNILIKKVFAEQNTKTRLANATITLTDSSGKKIKTVTDANGNFGLITDIGKGYKVTISSSGYKDLNFDWTPTSSNKNYFADIKMEKLNSSTQGSFEIKEVIRSVKINPGWNLLSLPIMPNESMNAKELLDQINNQGGEVYIISKWENSKWESYSLNTTSNNFVIKPGVSYFVNAIKTSTWQPSGEEITQSITLDLQPGWNAIGLPKTSCQIGVNCFASYILDKSNGKVLSRFESGLWESLAKEKQEVYGLDFVLDNYRGYFLKIDSSQKTTF